MRDFFFFSSSARPFFTFNPCILFPFLSFSLFFLSFSFFFEGGEEGQDTSNRGMLFSGVCLISVLNSVVTYQLKVSTSMIKYDEIA